MVQQYKGASRRHEVKASRRRKDTRLFGQKFSDFFNSGDGAVAGLFLLPVVSLLLIKIPLSGELIVLIALLYGRIFIRVDNRAFDFPYRVPKLAGARDGSIQGGKEIGKGVTMIGNDYETKEQIYAGDSDLRTHMLVLGTTGSGKPQPKNANVLTPSGWKKIGSLRPGDIVCTPDGKTASIIRVVEQGIQPVWTVQTRESGKADATGDHLWRVLTINPDEQEQAYTLTTDAIRELVSRNVQVLVPKVKRRGGSAKFTSWVPIWKIYEAGEHDCCCIEIDHPQHLYITDNCLVTHNTEFLLGLVFNALIQNTGFIYVDGKGDPKLQKEIFRLARYLGREDDLLIINFITSGRDFIDTQVDKVTNNMNIFGNTSSGMLVELIVSLMDDSGGGGDMWKGRAISFVAALTRPLIYLRDKGFINLSSEKYLEYFELNVIEELVFEHNGKYGEMFDVIVAPLRSYLVTLPGYQKAKLKKQETKTLEQHGFIVMQLTRIFNDLSFNYGHIFKTKVGDVDFFDVVVNRRLLVVLLPALERAPDSMRMLGKMIVGSIKQMMAGCLGNRVEGVIREIIDSRPTNAAFPFYTILDEYGYYAVIGFAVAPAQARSLGFSVIFAAQDFSSLKKSSAEEADATWENTNIRAIGRITSGEKSETWERIHGAASGADESRLAGFERRTGAINEVFRQQDNITIERRSRLEYDDLASQENGDFTFLIGKKEQGGRTGGVRVIRGVGFYTAGPTPKAMRINDFLPVEAPEPSDLPQNRKVVEGLLRALVEGSLPGLIRSALKADPLLSTLNLAFERNYLDPDRPKLSRVDAAHAILGWYLSGDGKLPDPVPATVKIAETESVNAEEPVVETDPMGLQAAAVNKALLDVADLVMNSPRNESVYSTATPLPVANDDDEIVIRAEAVTTSIIMTDEDNAAFRDRALPILRQHLFMLDDVPPEDEWEDSLSVADREQLLAMEILAGNSFETLEEKWDLEDRISFTRGAIARETTYIDPPEPQPIEIPEAKSKLSALIATCADLMKDSLRDDKA